MTRNKIVSIAFAVSLAAGAGASVVACGGADNSVSTAPSNSAPAKPAPADKPTPKPKAVSERSDLKSFKLNDRSAYGIDDVWVKFTITNSSSEKSDYTWDWEAIAPNGTRVDDGSEYVTNVLPGQTSKGDDVTMLTAGANVTLHITSFDRTASF